jgi:hypothetical protein
MVDWLVERAVLRLPEVDQERCREEWKADIAAMPTTLARIANAASYRFAARRIALNSFVDATTEKVAELQTSLDGVARDTCIAFDRLERAIERRSTVLATTLRAFDEVDHIARDEKEKHRFTGEAGEILGIRQNILTIKERTRRRDVRYGDSIRNARARIDALRIENALAASLLKRGSVWKASKVLDQVLTGIQQLNNESIAAASFDEVKEGEWETLVEMMEGFAQRFEVKVDKILNGSRKTI